MPKRDSYIRIRLYDEEKKKWEKFAKENYFDSISQFVRFIMNEHIEMGMKSQDASKAKKIMEKTEELERINALTATLQEERKEYMDKINDLLLELRRSRDVQISATMKGKILKWLKKVRLGSEEIAEILQVPEPEALDYLNNLIGQGLIRLNKDMKFEIINNGSTK